MSRATPSFRIECAHALPTCKASRVVPELDGIRKVGWRPRCHKSMGEQNVNCVKGRRGSVAVAGLCSLPAWTDPQAVHGSNKMKLATLTFAALLLSAGCAFAQGTNTMTSGRPSAVLDDAQCQAVWTMASPNGATISQDQAVPYIVNFSMVDGDGDGKISADEFKAGCAKGMVKSTAKP
jgi:hypothetical protein